MELFGAIIILLIGLILIIKGGDWFVDSASWIAHAAKIPTFIVGATIVSFATTLPELIVSVLATIQDKNDMAVGNAIGTINANAGIILAISLSFMSIVTPRKNYWQQCLLLVVSSLTLWLGCLSTSLNIWISLILLIMYFIFISINLFQGRLETKNQKDVILDTTLIIEDKKTKRIIVNRRTVIKKIIFFILGAIGIVLGSNLLINGGSTIAESLGVPERLIAITLVAIGTSLPELVTTITAIRKKEASLSIGNIIGANIFNITLILPICSLIAQDAFNISQQTLIIDFPFCLLFSLIATIPLLWKQRTYHWQGILMLITYVAYLTISIIL